jgi:hypothetical protein
MTFRFSQAGPDFLTADQSRFSGPAGRRPPGPAPLADEGEWQVRIDSLTQTVEPVACECTTGDPTDRPHEWEYPPSARVDMGADPSFAEILQRAELNPAKTSTQTKGKK